MGGYILRRLAQFVPVILGATALCWAMVWALPGNPFEGRCGQAPCPKAYVDQMTARYGLNRSLPAQYLRFLHNLVTGNLGDSFSGVPISTELRQAVPVTLRLALLAVLIQVVIAVAIGTYTGLRPNGVADYVSLLVGMAIFSLPIFVVGFVLQYLLGVRAGLVAPTVTPGAPVQDLILPAVVLALGSLATLMRVLRASVIEGMSSEYLRTARAKGLHPRRVVGVHLMRNAAVPSLNIIGLELAALLGGTVIVEGIFNIHGVGGLIYQAIQDREQVTVATVVTLVIVAYLAVNLVVDIVCALLDPRMRRE